MGVDGGVVGQAVVDDVGEVVDVESAGRHVGGHEYGDHAVAEFLHHYVALLLGEVAVEGFGVVAVADEVVGYLLGVAAGAAEDYGVDVGRVVDHALEGQIFVAGVDHVVDVAHVFCSFVAGSDHEFLVVFHVALGNLEDVRRHCGGEEQHLAVGGDVGEDFFDAVEEAHVEHLVGFIEHYGVYSVEADHSALYEVDQTAWGGDYDLDPFFESADLAFDA